MLKRLFKPKYVKFDQKYATLSLGDQQIVEEIAADIQNYVKIVRPLINLIIIRAPLMPKPIAALKLNLRS